MKVYLIGWEGDVHVFAWKEQAVDWHCLECDACKTWEDVVDDAKEINAEGNYHKYFAEEKEVE